MWGQLCTSRVDGSNGYRLEFKQCKRGTIEAYSNKGDCRVGNVKYIFVQVMHLRAICDKYVIVCVLHCDIVFVQFAKKRIRKVVACADQDLVNILYYSPVF